MSVLSAAPSPVPEGRHGDEGAEAILPLRQTPGMKNAHQRPLSPHLRIYRPQLTSLLSITHRGTGIVLAAGSLFLVYWLYALASGAAAYDHARAMVSAWYGQILLFGFSFSLFYHLCNGVRHLFWDAGLGFEIDAVYRSGKAVVGVSIALTVLTWIAAHATGSGP